MGAKHTTKKKEDNLTFDQIIEAAVTTPKEKVMASIQKEKEAKKAKRSNKKKSKD